MDVQKELDAVANIASNMYDLSKLQLAQSLAKKYLKRAKNVLELDRLHKRVIRNHLVSSREFEVTVQQAFDAYVKNEEHPKQDYNLFLNWVQSATVNDLWQIKNDLFEQYQEHGEAEMLIRVGEITLELQKRFIKAKRTIKTYSILTHQVRMLSFKINIKGHVRQVVSQLFKYLNDFSGSEEELIVCAVSGSYQISFSTSNIIESELNHKNRGLRGFVQSNSRRSWPTLPIRTGVALRA